MTALVGTLALVAALASVGAPSDEPLLGALQTDAIVRSCTCVVAARWMNESYPRVTIDEVRFQRLSQAARARFAARALTIAERVYLTEFAAVDQYERIFLVDRRGRALFTFGSG